MIGSPISVTPLFFVLLPRANSRPKGKGRVVRNPPSDECTLLKWKGFKDRTSGAFQGESVTEISAKESHCSDLTVARGRFGFPDRNSSETIRWVLSCEIADNYPGDSTKLPRTLVRSHAILCRALTPVYRSTPALQRARSALRFALWIGERSELVASTPGEERLRSSASTWVAW